MHQNVTFANEATSAPQSDTSSERLSVVTCWRRRVVLTYLRKNDTVGLSELVQHLARKRANAARRGPTAADEELSRVELFHIDIPLLADLELITYDSVSETISPASVVDDLDSAFFITES